MASTDKTPQSVLVLEAIVAMARAYVAAVDRIAKLEDELIELRRGEQGHVCTEACVGMMDFPHEDARRG